MMLAIVIPYYKIQFFEETLKSVEAQTDKRFVLYIGNDASKENPQEIIDQTLKTTQYKYVVYNENLGGKSLADQWERVIAETEDEEWIMILGDDDVLEKNTVEEFYKNLPLLQEQKLTLLKFSQKAIDQDGETIRDSTQLPQIYSSIKNIEDRMMKSFPSSLSEHVFSRKTFEKYKFKKFPVAWHSDDLAILEFANLENFVFCNNAKVLVRISAHSISGQDNSSVEKQFATYLFCEYLLSNYLFKFSTDFVRLLVKRYRENIWRNGFPMNIDLTQVFLKKKDYKNVLLSIKIKRELKKRIKLFNK